MDTFNDPIIASILASPLTGKRLSRFIIDQLPDRLPHDDADQQPH